jgi:hypothetical protein
LDLCGKLYRPAQNILEEIAETLALRHINYINHRIAWRVAPPMTLRWNPTYATQSDLSATSLKLVNKFRRGQVKKLFIGLGLAKPRGMSEILDIYYTVCYTQLATQRLRAFGMGNSYRIY